MELFFFLIAYALHIPLPSEKNPICIYSTHTRDDLKQTTLKALRQAKHSISIHTYSLTDPAVLTLLKQKADQGVEVHLFYHKKTTPPIHHIKHPRLHFHPVQGKGLMHEKWMVIDQILVFFGTANLTLSSLTMHDNLLLGLHCPPLAKALKKESSSHHTQTIGTQTLDLFFLPHNAALDYLLATLDTAKKKVTLALFTFTHPAIVAKLLKLHERGIQVDLYVDTYTARGASKKALSQLSEGGLSPAVSQGPALFHHKWAVIDSEILILGSANWTQAAFKKNKDFILFLKPLTKNQLKITDAITKIIKNETHPPKVVETSSRNK